MQVLTDSPRQDLTPGVVRDLLTGQGVRRGFGLELLDQSNRVVGALDCRGFTVKYTGDALIRKTLTVADLTTELAWGRDRVRPFVTLTKGVTARFDVGVYVLATPETKRGRTPSVCNATGQDLTFLLDRHIGETYVAAADGTLTYFQALRALLVAAGIDGTVLLDGTRQDTPIPTTMVWVLTQDPTWLDVANDLLAAIAYTDLWNDQAGNFRARPIAPLESRPVEWTFDTADPATDLVAADWTETQDLWSAFNVWRGVADPWPSTPIAGDGLYEVVNQSDGLSSVDSVGRRPHPLISVNVADQAALVAEVERLKAADQRAERQAVIRVDPLPIAGHADVVVLQYAGQAWKTQVAEWELVAGGGADASSQKGSWTLGGLPSGGRERSESQTTATVTSAAPLRVVVDGATVDSFANALDAATYAIGQRCTVTVRNPNPPLVNGVES